jgi:hypothetical protein
VNRAWIVAVAVVVLAGIRLYAGEARPAADFRLAVCMDYQGNGDLRTASLAEAIASRMFRRIGVTLIWVHSKSCPPDAIHIALTVRTPDTLRPGALAYALPLEGAHIRVFRDRIEANQPALVPHLLAHVLVHEIIHMLQARIRHSESGVMKAHWDRVDFTQMQWGELPIGQEDIDLVHAAMEKRARLAAGHRNQGGMAENPAPALAAPILVTAR